MATDITVFAGSRPPVSEATAVAVVNVFPSANSPPGALPGSEALSQPVVTSARAASSGQVRPAIRAGRADGRLSSSHVDMRVPTSEGSSR
ncbi:hypothetical protein [Streptomyces sp. H27-H1]|uniref:hypothetical protein n=1 Tax=Streptomyces sp. H27-H1 TaxID=2996461 RepID=UPI00226DBBC6|nr:hypothetical protein [Streptomyces sp. H27-H1]